MYIANHKSLLQRIIRVNFGDNLDETTEEENATSTEIVLEEIEELTDYSSESKVGFGMKISINPSIFTR